MTPQAPLIASDKQKRLAALVDDFHRRSATNRFYVHTDKPLYQPGETVWFRVWELATQTMMTPQDGHGVRVELVSPKGASVLDKRIQGQAGLVTNDFEIPDSVQGGEYTLRVTSDAGGQSERKIIVSTYEPPQIKKKLEFLRKAYGAGDKVMASLALSRGTGESLANSTARIVASVDGVELKRFTVTTDDKGEAVVRFDLPARIQSGDGLLTVLVDDAGITESIQKRIPIVVKSLSVEMFPEGGDLVNGLPGRVYFSAKNPLGKPADIHGRVVDDRGVEVAKVVSLHNGMGRFDITPVAGRSYRLEVGKPAGIAKTFELPEIKDEGCTMQAVDDYQGKRADVRVGVWCSQAQTVIGTASLREKRLGDVAVEVAPGAPSLVSLAVPAGAQGAVRFTVLSEELQPLAERLIYRNRGADLEVSIDAKKDAYSPRDRVRLELTTKDPAGKPVAADMSLAVVDDTVLSFADDKTANLLARVYLESEMPGQEIEEPNFYFGSDSKAPYALDMVLGTQGWRRFDWQQVLVPPVPETTTAMMDDGPMGGAMAEPMDMAPRPAPVARPKPANKKAPMAPAPRQAAGPPAKRGEMKPVEAREQRPKADAAFRGRRAGFALAGKLKEEEAKDAAFAERDDDWAGADEEAPAFVWAPVRQFPAPNYGNAEDYDGPRNDFRETIFWQPSVKTNERGKATVDFYLSDAVTSFRVVAEGGTAGGSLGRGEAMVRSKLPISLAVKMPNEVSADDTLQLPITLVNETKRRETAKLEWSFGKAFKLVKPLPASVTLDGGERVSLFAELRVVGDGKNPDDGALAVRMDARRLKDEVAKTVKVVPLGFPQEVSLSGTLADKSRHEVDLGGIIPGSIDASITLYPSPVATMMKGMEAIIREPSGCFEQTSSANYPNIMVLAYLEEHDSADAAVVGKAADMLDRGYKRLVGYESKSKGFEWFGEDPGHEALSAYGLMEFADMKAVYGDVDDKMISRTRAWLRSRRDGKGGYLRNDRALDSFGRASVEVTNGYITYALSEAGEKDLGHELAYQKRMAQSTRDPYLMALAANTLVNLEPRAASTTAALAKLATMQKEDGVLSGADHSITRSGGQALDIETTSLALLAFLDGGGDYMAPAVKAAKWINTQRDGFGGYGSTQSTVLALKALTTYANKSRVTRASGLVRVRINGKAAGQMRFEKGHEGALVFENVGKLLKPGKNDIELELESEAKLPYSVAIEYRSKTPPSSPKSPVRISTRLSKRSVPMGEGARVDVEVVNTSSEGQPMTLARVGIPGGMRFQTWQLKELRDKGIIGFYETRAREVVLYFRDMKPKAKVKVPLELIAEVPGEFVAPASSAYLYYTDEFKDWTEPVKVAITR